jgi:sec-independent protein translocase protein TatC
MLGGDVTDSSPPAALPDPDALPRMTLSEHLDELRSRLLWSVIAILVAMLVSFVFWEPVWEFVKLPFEEAARLQGVEDPKLMSLDPGEGFISILKLSFLVGFVLASPVVLWQLWGFVAAGLYAHERRIVRIFFPISLGLFSLGVVLAYQVLIPFGMRFLIGWNKDMDVETTFRIQTYISTCLTMVFGMAVLFLLPLVMLFVQAANIVEPQTFKKHWRIAVLLSFVVGMFLTDPSPVTQILMAMPTVGLYFLGIYGGAFVGENRKTFRWYHAWPLVIGAVLIALMLAFSDEINAWSAKLFGAGQKVEQPAAPPDPEAPSPPVEQD